MVDALLEGLNIRARNGQLSKGASAFSRFDMSPPLVVAGGMEPLLTL